jgi:hypothetical protein
MSNCPMIGQWMSSCPLVGQCMSNGSMVVQMIALYCINYPSTQCILKLLSRNVANFYALSQQEILTKYAPFVGQLLSDQVMLLDSFKLF